MTEPIRKKLKIDFNEKCSWSNATHNHDLLIGDSYIDWSRTKYGRRDKSGYRDVDPEYTLNRLYKKFTSYTIPGIIANHICEFPFDKQNNCYHFIPNREYDSKEILNICGGVLYGVVYRTDNTIQVTFKQYDHHNEPITTQEFMLTYNQD
tara:strand:+ start:94 stop:543 length:450 start_codon:yes stop_codon:yes gene_type:complete